MTEQLLSRCSGTLPRRAFLRTGLAGLCSLSLADLLRLEAHGGWLGSSEASPQEPRVASSATGKSVIVLWLWGGPSHMDTFDLKPAAPLEYRGDFSPIRTNVPGIEICEHLPRLAKLADKFALVRSCHHDSPGHVNSTHTMLTGYKGKAVEMPPYRPDYPDFWAVTSRVLGERVAGMPVHVALPRMRYNGAAYLGSDLDPFVVTADPNSEKFEVPNLSLRGELKPRFAGRLTLLDRFDQFRRDLDEAGTMEAIDEFHKKAADLLTSDRVRKAFDVAGEDPQVRDRYGRHDVGQRLLLARRLVESGVRLVTVDFPCVAGQKAFSWDDHASVWHIFEQMKIRLPVLDQVVSATIRDLYERGLQDDVLFVVMGEMSHTPKLSNYQGQPGREHWAQAMSILLSGGGMPMGQVIGSTTPKGEVPQNRPVTPDDVLATWYRYLGIPLDTHFTNHAGRPTPILPTGTAIGELV